MILITYWLLGRNAKTSFHPTLKKLLYARTKQPRDLCRFLLSWWSGLPHYCWLLHTLAKHCPNEPPASTLFEHWGSVSVILLCQTSYGQMVDHNSPPEILPTFPTNGASFIKCHQHTTHKVMAKLSQWYLLYEETQYHILPLSWWRHILSCSAAVQKHTISQGWTVPSPETVWHASTRLTSCTPPFLSIMLVKTTKRSWNTGQILTRANPSLLRSSCS